MSKNPLLRRRTIYYLSSGIGSRTAREGFFRVSVGHRIRESKSSPLLCIHFISGSTSTNSGPGWSWDVLRGCACQYGSREGFPWCNKGEQSLSCSRCPCSSSPSTDSGPGWCWDVLRGCACSYSCTDIEIQKHLISSVLSGTGKWVPPGRVFLGVSAGYLIRESRVIPLAGARAYELRMRP